MCENVDCSVRVKSKRDTQRSSRLRRGLAESPEPSFLTAHLPYSCEGRKKKLKEGNGDCIDVSSIQCSIIPGNTWQYLAIHNAIYNGI